MTGICRPAFWNSGNEAARAVPKSLTTASIVGYFDSSEDTTCWVVAGSQFVTLYGDWPSRCRPGYFLNTLCRPWYSARLWELAGGPPRNTTLPLPFSAVATSLPQSTPAEVKSVEM